MSLVVLFAVCQVGLPLLHPSLDACRVIEVLGFGSPSLPAGGSFEFCHLAGRAGWCFMPCRAFCWRLRQTQGIGNLPRELTTPERLGDPPPLQSSAARVQSVQLPS